MKAFAITSRPKPGRLTDTLEFLDVPQPCPKKKQLLVEVHATSINIDDIRIAEGTVAGGVPIGPTPKPSLPVVPGMDVSGIVVKVGSKVSRFKIGDEVFGVCDARNRNGAWAEYCCANEGQLLLKPNDWSFAEAAGVGVVGGVACFAVDAAKVKKGDRCIVIGASGGIGSSIVKLAHSRGAEVVGVCSTRNVERVLEFGAKRVFDYTRENFATTLVAENSLPYDAVFDCIGGADTERDSLRILAKTGTFVTSVGPVYFNGDKKLGALNLLRFFAYILYRMLASSIAGPRYVMAGPTKKTYRNLVPELVQKRILPAMDDSIDFDLKAIMKAIRYVSLHHSSGKVIMNVKLPTVLP